MTCHGLVKCLMFFVNFICSIIGIAIVAFAAYYMQKLKDISPDMAGATYAGTFVIIIGIIIFLISFTGCCGAIKEINCLLVMYILVMFLLVAVKVIAAGYILTKENEIKDQANALVSAMDVKDNDPMQVLEFLTKCCGTTGPDSYTNANITIPLACCPVNIFGAPKNCTDDSKDIYQDGCRDVAPQKIEASLNNVMYSLLGIALFELLSMMSAIYLTCTRKKGEYYDYD